MISRSRAINTLNELVDALDTLGSDMTEEIQDIISCIRAEQDWQIHAWDMPDDDYTTLCTAMRTDLPEFAEFAKNQERIANDYTYTPSKMEK